MPPSDSSSLKKSRRIYVRPRTGPQSAHLWWPAVAKLQAANVPVVWAAALCDRQTDGSRYSKMSRSDGDIITRSNYMQLRCCLISKCIAIHMIIKVILVVTLLLLLCVLVLLNVRFTMRRNYFIVQLVQLSVK